MTMRMFVAVRPPIEVTEDLAEFVEPRRERDSPLRWASPASWHLTLAFMPAVADRDYDELIELLEETASKRAPFDLHLAGAGTFPNPALAKVLYAGVAGDTGKLENLSKVTRSAASRAGVEADGAKFTPHVTLARTNRPLDVTRWLRVFDLYSGPSWTVTEMALIQSQGGGGQYEVHDVFELAGE